MVLTTILFLLPSVEFRVELPHLAFYMSVGVLDSGPQVLVVGTLSTEPHLQSPLGALGALHREGVRVDMGSDQRES